MQSYNRLIDICYGISKHSFPFSPNIYNKRVLKEEPKYGDLVVFKTPSDNRTDYIKRVIGLPGDTIQFINGDLYFNESVCNKYEETIEDRYNINMYYDSANKSCGSRKISVYGNKNQLPFSENDRMDSPISVYATTKITNEKLAYTYNHLYGLKTTGFNSPLDIFDK